MAKKVTVGITENYFDSVSRQKLPMSDAACEPVDNALSNCTGPVNILVAVEKAATKDLYAMVIADWGDGMSEEEFPESLQFGTKHTDEGPLCIHGVGLNNFILVATRNKYPWFIATKKRDEGVYRRIDGPFAKTMTMTEQKEIPLENIVMREHYKALGAPSTIIYVEMDKNTASTMLTKNGSCAPSKVYNPNVLRVCLAEHFGVKYRNYLKPDVTGVAPARILIPNYWMDNRKTCDVFVKPIFQQYKMKQKTKSFTVEHNGYSIPVTVESGLLDAVTTKEDNVTGGYDLKHFYQNNEATQGVDIQLGDRVIATAQLESIWSRGRHPSLNAFTGTVAVDISGLPRGFLNTLANKSDIDMSDSGWRAIFDAVASQVSLMESNPFSIEDYAKEFAKKLAFDTGNEVELQFPLYANRTRIDVLEHLGEGQCRIYDFMSTKANLKSLEELRTHWDGMVSQGQQPISAVMYCPSRGPMLPHSCEEFNNRIQAMDDTDYAKAIKATDGDVSKMPHYNFDVTIDPNIPASK